MSQFGALARWVVKKGIDNLDASMLSPDVRKEVLTEVGLLLLKEGRIEEAVKAVVMAENREKLIEMGDEFMRQNKFEQATLAFIPTKDKQRLEKAAALCAKEGRYALALHAFIAAGNDEMARFIRDNFCLGSE